MSMIGILGGTFDPVHYGHLCLAKATLRKLKLDQVRLMPLHTPPHRQHPIASAKDRKNMLQFAIEQEAQLHLELRELEQDKISYTIDTLASLKQDYPSDVLLLIVGQDAFNSIDTWKDWQRLLEYTHITVVYRENKIYLSSKLKAWITTHRVNDSSFLRSAQNGYIYYIDMPAINISATMIRHAFKENIGVSHFLPAKTLDYIKEKQLYNA